MILLSCLPSWAHQVLTLPIVILVNRMKYELLSLGSEKPSSDLGVKPSNYNGSGLSQCPSDQTMGRRQTSRQS